MKGTQAVKTRNNAMDLVKVFAALFVVLIHFPFPGITGNILKAEGRFAVLFFFMISGFFCVKPGEKFVPKVLKRKIWHIAAIYFAAAALYLIYNCVSGGLGFINERFSDLSVTRYSLVRYLVFNDPILTHSHLWFLLALIYSYLLFFAVAKIPLVNKGGVEDIYNNSFAGFEYFCSRNTSLFWSSLKCVLL